MVTLGTILIYVLFSSILGLSGGILLLYKRKFTYKISFYLVCFAAGTLLGAAFLDILPEALTIGNKETIFIYTLIGILSFFFIEKFLIWHHHHTYGAKEIHSLNYMIIFGDTLHNFIDGMIQAATFLVSLPLGIVTFLAVLFHEIPQEIGDFSLLLYGKMEKIKIILYNVLSALVALLGAVVAYFFVNSVQSLTTPLLAFAAGGFIYIAASDLIPETKKESRLKRSILQIILLVIGILAIWLTGKIFVE
jgi:zinc and cadmium transporter